MIPARMASVRLPGKPLVSIGDAPMIVQVWRRAMSAHCGRVVVATDAPEIAEAVSAHGGEAVMTRDDHASGSDRIWEAVQAIDPDGKYRNIINVQGDLPTLPPTDIQTVANILHTQDACDIATLAALITEESERDNPNVVKPVISFYDKQHGRALYFTRATAPHGGGALYHHIGIYAYRREALAKFVGLAPSPLEKRERLEQLRAIEANMRIDVGVVDSMPLGVDTQEDVIKARAVIDRL